VYGTTVILDRSHSIFLLFALHLSLSVCYADEFVVVVGCVMAVFVAVKYLCLIVAGS
jgi:hypothetical protein